MTEELTFHLEEFEGPLELLLALVSKHKMDLRNIPILELNDQSTRTVEAAQAVDPDISSSFLEMAAHLQAVMVQKIDRTLVQITAENLTALGAADFSGGGDRFQIDGFTGVAVNIGNHIALDQKIWIL